jgi:hypothetical protein
VDDVDSLLRRADALLNEVLALLDQAEVRLALVDEDGSAYGPETAEGLAAADGATGSATQR